MTWQEIQQKAHAKNPNDYECARLKIYAPVDSDLHEITLTYIKMLDHNGAWNFAIQHIENEKRNIVTFRYNGTLTALTAIAKLHFHCEHTVEWEWLDTKKYFIVNTQWKYINTGL